MSLELSRLFIASLPDTVINLTAALIFLGEDLKKLWLRGFLCGILYGVITWVTFNVIPLNIIRVLLNTAIFLVLIRGLLPFQWWGAVKTLILATFFSFSANTVAALVAIYGLKAPMARVAADKSIWLGIFLPAFLLSPIAACIARKLRSPVLYFFAKIKANGISQFRSLFITIALQALLLLSLFVQDMTAMDSGRNPLIPAVSLITVISIIGLGIFILYTAIRVTEEKVYANTEDAMAKNVSSLINTVRSQRHDFINYIQIIKFLCDQKKFEALNTYLLQLTNDIYQINDMLKIDNPFISAVLNTKMTQAGIRGIKLMTDINADLSNLSVQALDLTRILGNLIDNAFDAVEQCADLDKWVSVVIKEKGPFLSFSVTNPGSPPAEFADKIFIPGFTTKGDCHSGLGLYICKQLAEKLHGKINYTFNDNSGIRFSLILPKN